jgi:hypothetical protein
MVNAGSGTLSLGSASGCGSGRTTGCSTDDGRCRGVGRFSARGGSRGAIGSTRGGSTRSNVTSSGTTRTSARIQSGSVNSSAACSMQLAPTNAARTRAA